MKKAWIEGEKAAMEKHSDIEVVMPEETAHLMEQRRISLEDIKKTIYHAENTREKFVHPATGHFLAGVRPYFVTFWVEYGITDKGYEVYTAYSHRVKVTRSETR
jgi:glutamate synthase (NADPH) small chain